MLLSPFTTLLRLYVDSGQMNADDNLRVLLQYMIKESAILKPATNVSSLDVLVLSLKESKDWKASDFLYDFLDNCVLRFARKPIKYCDSLTILLDDAKSSQTDFKGLDLLFVVILEQWPFLIKASVASDTITVARWLSRYLNLSMGAGGDLVLLSRIRDGLKNEVKDKECCALLKNAFREQVEFGNCSVLESIDRSSRIIHGCDGIPYSQPKLAHWREIPLPPGPPEEDEDHAGLRKWILKDTQDAIEDGSVEDLIFCLCSRHEAIRKQALRALSAFVAKLEVIVTSHFIPIF